MAYHCYHNTACPNCRRFYVRFRDEEVCPWCGSDAAPVYALVDEIVHYARITLTSQGDLDLSAFVPATLADAYVVHAYRSLEAFRLHPELPPDVVAAEAVRHWRLGDGDASTAHWLRFLTALLTTWQEQRNQPLEPPPIPDDPSEPPPGRGPTPRDDPDRPPRSADFEDSEFKKPPSVPKEPEP